MADAREGASYLIGTLGVLVGARGVRATEEVDWLTALQSDDGVQLPAVCEQRGTAESGNVVVDVADEGIAGVKVAGTVVAFEVGAVLRQLAAVLRHLIEVMTPRVAELR